MGFFFFLKMATKKEFQENYQKNLGIKNVNSIFAFIVVKLTFDFL